jgi:hypothetical protein
MAVDINALEARINHLIQVDQANATFNVFEIKELISKYNDLQNTLEAVEFEFLGARNGHIRTNIDIAKICGEDISDEPRSKWARSAVHSVANDRLMRKKKMNDAYGKLVAATKCHPKVVQVLIEEAIEILTVPANEVTDIKDPIV